MGMLQLPVTVVVIGVGFFQRTVIDLAHAGQGQFIYRQNSHRLASLFHSFIAVTEDLGTSIPLVNTGHSFDQHQRILTLAVLPVINTDDSAVVNILAAGDIAFQVDGEDFVTVETGDHTLDASLDIQEAILVDVAQVAGVDPDLAIGMLTHYKIGFLGVIEVTLHHGRTGNTNLTVSVVAQLLTGFGIEDAHIHGQRGDADAALAVNFVYAEGSRGRKLG